MVGRGHGRPPPGVIRLGGCTLIDQMKMTKEALERCEAERAEQLVRDHILNLAAHGARACTYLA